jgi:hypothetical protein
MRMRDMVSTFIEITTNKENPGGENDRNTTVGSVAGAVDCH